jgi:transcriptional regulator with XRE-family HTH domain
MKEIKMARAKHSAVGNPIYQYRERRNLSLQQFAKELGVSRQSLYSWEKSVCIPKPSKLTRLAKVMSVDRGKLYDELVKLIDKKSRQ